VLARELRTNTWLLFKSLIAFELLEALKTLLSSNFNFSDVGIFRLSDFVAPFIFFKIR
jgi:hypothetical protein